MTQGFGSAAAIAAGLVLALAAPAAHAQKAKDTLRYADSINLDVVDPYYTGAREITMIIGEMAFDTLIYRDPISFQHKPLLASSWKWATETTIEMELRKDVKWHDGQPFTAADVKYTLDYIIDPKNKVYHRDWSSWIKGTEIVDDHKVRIYAKSPFGPALEYLALLLPIVPKDFYDAAGKAGANGRLVGTGPYRIAEFVPGKGAKFEINRAYFANDSKGRPSIGRIEMRNLPDEATQVAELLSGGVDWIWRVSPNHLDNIRRTKGIQVGSGATMRMTWIGFDVEGKSGKTFQDVRVRRAVAHAINREQLVKEIIGPGGKVLKTPCFPAQFGCYDENKVAFYEYNPAKARQLLAEAGYPNGLQITLTTYQSGPQRTVAEAVQGFLRNVGVDAKLQVLGNFKPFFEAIADGKVPIQITSYGSYNVGDVQIILPLWFGGESRDSIHDPELKAWVKEGSTISDPARRKELFEKATKYIMEQSYWVPLLLQAVNYAYTTDLDIPIWEDENPRFFLAKWKK